MTASTRRAALGAILAAPLASVPAVAAPTISPKLAQIIAEHDAHNAMMNARPDDRWPTKAEVKEGGRLRALVAGFPSNGWPDTMAKAACLRRTWTMEDAEEELQSEISGGYAYLSGMALAIACEVMRYGEAGSCA